MRETRGETSRTNRKKNGAVKPTKRKAHMSSIELETALRKELALVKADNYRILAALRHAADELEWASRHARKAIARAEGRQP